MKQHLKFILLLLGCLAATDSYAQRVVTVGNQVIIEAEGIPKHRITDVKKPTGTGTTPENSIGSQVNDKKVYYRFEVSKQDNHTGTGWLNGVNLCKNLNYNGNTGWRLPTRCELVLIWILKSELEKQSGFVKFSQSDFMSATESNEYYHILRFQDALSNKLQKSSRSKVRCIRDL